MNALEKIRRELVTPDGLAPMRVLCASGALGFGIPPASLQNGFDRNPHVVGCDMGSVDPGPHYLGSGEMGASDAIARLDLERVLLGCRKAGIPLLIGTAGTAGAAVQVDKVSKMVRDIAAKHDLHFQLARVYSDMDKSMVADAVAGGRVRPLGAMPEVTPHDVRNCRAIVGQMGVEPFQRALEAGADVVIAGRSCDTAIFAALPLMLGYPVGPTIHLSKIIECASLCCIPGGPDPILGTLEDDSFVLESMDPARIVTPISASAHSLYEEADPFVIHEPDGKVTLDDVRFVSIDARRVRGSGAKWVPAERETVKIEGVSYEGERAILLAGTADPRVIAHLDNILSAIEAKLAIVLPEELRGFQVSFRRYGLDGVTGLPVPGDYIPREVFLMGECIAPQAEQAVAVLAVAKQHLLHHGFEGRLSTGGNIAFPFTPPEVHTGPAWRFRLYHVMDVDSLAPLFPMRLEQV